ncbi:hypothetical protein A6R68_15332 [Neotoma lepida]|uniref:Uncharacterized protein n=1 Tax=Neotoma lepida TaxID=56216 RepID=A0A1A6H8D5_NEOLE|nr:hypothetical protein A6R68_15332 [Neotoma lepida]
MSAVPPPAHTEKPPGVLAPRVRSCRRPARPASGAPGPDALKGLVSQSPLVEPQADDSSEPLPPTVEVALSSTEEEVHYASLSFHEMKPRNPQGQHDTTTEYSEIKSHNEQLDSERGHPKNEMRESSPPASCGKYNAIREMAPSHGPQHLHKGSSPSSAPWSPQLRAGADLYHPFYQF